MFQSSELREVDHAEGQLGIGGEGLERVPQVQDGGHQPVAQGQIRNFHRIAARGRRRQAGCKKKIKYNGEKKCVKNLFINWCSC